MRSRQGIFVWRRNSRPQPTLGPLGFFLRFTRLFRLLSLWMLTVSLIFSVSIARYSNLCVSDSHEACLREPCEIYKSDRFRQPSNLIRDIRFSTFRKWQRALNYLLTILKGEEKKNKKGFSCRDFV